MTSIYRKPVAIWYDLKSERDQWPVDIERQKEEDEKGGGRGGGGRGEDNVDFDTNRSVCLSSFSSCLRTISNYREPFCRLKQITLWSASLNHSHSLLNRLYVGKPSPIISHSYTIPISLLVYDDPRIWPWMILQLQYLRFTQRWLWRMASSGMLHRVALVRTDVSEEFRASIIRVTRIVELGTTLAVTSNVVPSSPIHVTLMMEKLRSSETSFLTRATRRNFQEVAIPGITIVDKN
jgi:hypothetical protein